MGRSASEVAQCWTPQALNRVRLLLTRATLGALSAWTLIGAPAAIAQKATPPPVVEGKDGWLFLASELRFFSFPKFWGEAAPKAARSPKPENADPIPAIVDFHNQLSKQGVHLLVVPVPPKAWNNPHAPEAASKGFAPGALDGFFEQLSGAGVDFVDLRPVFSRTETRENPMYCRTDSHWSGTGCTTAAKAVAEKIRPLLAAGGAGAALQTTRHPPKTVLIRGDLGELLQKKSTAMESVTVHEVTDASGGTLKPLAASPVLILGDSHILVFHDFLAERAGFPDQMAAETSVAPDWIGTRGSGSNAVRLSLLRKNLKDPGYLASKKVVVWCFAARELTEADQGWQKIPLQRSP